VPSILHCQRPGKEFRQQSAALVLDDGVTLATQPLEFGAIEHADVSAFVFDNPESVQFSGGFGHALAAHPEHVGDEFLGHVHLVTGQTVQRHEQPAAQLLVNGVMAVAHGRLRHLVIRHWV
jgi:hypothetical protein